MTTNLKPKKQRGAGKVAALVAGVALVAIAFGAYKLFFNRPGEAAIQLIPSIAKVVVTLDTSPSESQVVTFKRISDALEREGITNKIDDQLKGMFEKSSLGRDIRPLLSTSFAFCTFGPEQNTNYAVLTAVSDPGQVSNSLQRNAKLLKDNPSTYSIPELNQCCAVIGNYFVVADSAGSISLIDSLHNGTGQSLAALPEYQEARKSLPRDANLMVFVSPSQLKEVQKMFKSEGISGMSWLTFGATVRDDGIAFDYRGPLDSKVSTALAAMAEIPALSADILNKLPGGAYGLFAYSQPARYWDAFEEQAKKDPAALEMFTKSLSEFESSSGLSIEKDLLPAFQGDAICAVYPGISGEQDDVDLVIMLDDKNGANPAAVIPKLRDWLAKQKENVYFVESKLGEATVWELDQETLVRLRKEVKGGPKINNKTLVCAAIGNNVVVTTTREMLSKAMDAFAGRNTLATDAPFNAMSKRLVSDSQANVMVSLRRVMEAARPEIEKSLKDSSIKIDEVIQLFGDLNTGLVGSAKYDGKTMVGSLFLPLEYETMIKLIGEMMRNPAGLSSGDTGYVEPEMSITK